MNVHDHKLLKVARENEENFINAIINRELDWDIMKITLLYDYDNAFSNFIDQIDESPPDFMREWCKHVIARFIIFYGATGCMRLFVKKFGYIELLFQSMEVRHYNISKYCLENDADIKKTIKLLKSKYGKSDENIKKLYSRI